MTLPHLAHLVLAMKRCAMSFVRTRRVAEKKPLSEAIKWAQPARMGTSAPWIDIYHAIRGAADGDRQGRLEAPEEILDVVGAKAAADAQRRGV